MDLSAALLDLGTRRRRLLTGVAVFFEPFVYLSERAHVWCDGSEVRGSIMLLSREKSLLLSVRKRDCLVASCSASFECI